LFCCNGQAISLLFNAATFAYSDRQNSSPPGVANSRSTAGTSPHRRVLTDSLIPPWIPVQFLNRPSPFAFSPSRTPQWLAMPGPFLGKCPRQLPSQDELPPFRRRNLQIDPTLGALVLFCPPKKAF
jgi:hypothetical protein